MLFIFWPILSVLLFCLTFYLGIKAVKFLNVQGRVIPALIFVIILGSFITPNNNATTPTREVKKWKFIEDSATNTFYFTNVVFKKVMITPSIDINIGAVYGVVKETKISIPKEGFSTITGDVSNHSWVPDFISITATTSKNRFAYTMHGILKWKLWGRPIYSQSKTFIGYIDIN